MLTKEQLAAYEKEYITVIHIVGQKEPHDKEPPWEVVVRPPTRAEYKAMRDEINRGSTKPDAQENLVTGCIVYPSHDAFQALLDGIPGQTPPRPAIADAICTHPAVMRMMGFSAEVQAKR